MATLDLNSINKVLASHGYNPYGTAPARDRQAEKDQNKAKRQQTMSGIVEFLADMGNVSSYADRTAAADLLANGGSPELSGQIQKVNDAQAKKGAETTRYVAEKAASGVANTAQGIANAATLAMQKLGEIQMQETANSLDAISALAGTGKAKKNAEDYRKQTEQVQASEALTPAEFGTKYSQNIENRYDVSEGIKAVGGVSETIGAMVPAILSNYLVPGSSLYVMGLGAAGNAATEAIKSGANRDTAMLYGAAVGTLEALTEKMFDGVAGVFGKGAADEWLENAVKNAVKSEAGQKAVLHLADMLGEGAEEFVSEVGDRLLNRLTVNTDARTLRETMTDAQYSAFMGALVSGVMQTAGSINTKDPGKAAEAVVDKVMDAWDKGKAAVAEMGTKKAALPKMSMADFSDSNSPVWNMLEYGDESAKSDIMQSTHQQMVSEGKVVTVPESDIAEVNKHYPDLRSMKKAERTPILRSKMDELKSTLRNFLNTLKNVNYEFEVNGNVLDARLYNTGIEEVMHGIKQDKAAMLLSSNEIFKNARYMYSTPDYDGDPNIYRWNYFYSPVKIGDAVVGVRIAVRDMATTKESQIYNWKLKRNTALDGGGRLSNDSISSDVSSAVKSLDTIIAQTTPGVKSDNTTPQTQDVSNKLPDTSVGAASAGFTGNAERGFGKNIATDSNMEAELREDFELAPDPYWQLTNKETLKKAENIYAKGLNTARSEVETALGKAEAGMKLAPEIVPLARMVANQLTRDGDIDTARNILSRVAVELTTAGQLGQAAKILRNAGPATAMEAIEKALERINSALPKNSKWRAKLTEAEIEQIRNTNFDTEGAFENIYEQVAKRIGAEMPSTLWEKLVEIRRVGMLLNPRTQVKNVAGNVPMLAVRKTAERLSGAIQSAFVKAGVMDASEQTRTATQSKQSREIAKRLFEANVDALKGTSNKWDMKPLIREYRKYFGNTKAGQAMDAVRTFTYELLDKGDNPFLKSAFIDSAAGYIEAQGYTDIKNVPQSVIDFAVQNALEATFKDASRLAQFLNSIKREGAAGAVLDVLFPFTTTPINISKRLYEYSPLSVIKVVNDVRTGESLAKTIDDAAKTLTGSAVVGLGFILRSLGAITGGRDEDKDKAAWDNATGNAAYSFGGKVSYDWASPTGSLLAMGAEVADAFAGNESFLDAVFNTLYTTGDSLLELSFFKDVLDLLKGYGSPTEKVVEEFAASIVSQLTPSLGTTFAKMFDDTVRTSYTGGTALDDALAAFKMKVPGLSNDLPASVNVKGEENKRADTFLGRVFDSAINPANTNYGAMNAVDRFLEDVYEATGNKTIFPSVAAYSVEGEEETYKLTGKQREKFQKTRGQTYYDVAELILEVADNLDKDEQALLLKKANTYAGAIAKQEFLEGKDEEYKLTGDAAWMANAVEAAENGIDLDIWFKVSEYESDAKADKDKKGNPISGSKKEKVIDFIDDLKTSDENKDYLLLAFYPAKSAKAERKELNKAPWNRD